MSFLSFVSFEFSLEFFGRPPAACPVAVGAMPGAAGGAGGAGHNIGDVVQHTIGDEVRDLILIKLQITCAAGATRVSAVTS